MTDTAGGRDARKADKPTLATPQDERLAVARELEEIELLLTQAKSEADRHETRRRQAAERLDQMLSSAPAPLREGHDQLLLQTQRAALMSAQIEVLEGKQRVLRRYADSLDQRAAGGDSGGVAGGGSAAAGNGNGAQSRDVLAAQEDLRRLIARQMHDGPAQSIANIALQAEVVQRLLARDPAAAGRELDDLRRMVQHALEATKTFIFEVRPMVLDDLGLLPTLRRGARERSVKAGIAVELESRGQDRRLEPEIESNLFRIVDDAVAGYLASRPGKVHVRLDWAEDGVNAIVLSELPAAAVAAARAPAPIAPRGDVPPALAEMIASHEAEVTERATARRRAYALPEALWNALLARAQTVEIALQLVDDGLGLEANYRESPASGKA